MTTQIQTEDQARRIILAAQKERVWRDIAFERGAEGFINFLKLVRTKDEKDSGKVKFFPMKDYILDLAEEFATEPLLAVIKSRQMTVSWLACAYCVWRAYTLPNQLILWQSKNLEDAAAMVFDKDDPQVARCSFICEFLPRWAFVSPKYSYANHLYPNGSRIRGTAQGPNVIRSNAASVIIADEAAFQEDAEAAFTAAKPALEGGGQYIGISSANIGFFDDIVNDRIGHSYEDSDQ